MTRRHRHLTRCALTALALGSGLSSAFAADGDGADRIITAQQKSLDLEALKLLDTPVGRAASELSGRVLYNYAGATGDKAVFEAALKTTVFCGALIAANSDSRFPKIHAQGIPAHDVGTTHVPDSSCAIPNADTIYRFIPVDGTSHYEITGHVAAHRPIENNFTLASYSLTTIGNINGRDLKVAPDGSFKITIGPEPANGRPNYLQSRHDAFQVWVRDTLGDWSKERPNRLEVRRLDALAPGEKPIDDNGKLATIVRFTSYAIFSMPAAVIEAPVNTWPQPKILGGAAGAGGFLVTQAYSNSLFRIADDEAIVLKVRLGFAGYSVVPLTNLWGTNDGVNGKKTGSLNNFQAHAEADGSYLYVISKKDPGLDNWVDTAGLNEGTLYLRFAGFPQGDLTGKTPPSIETSVVKLSDLARVAPGAKRVSAAERQAQVLHRQEALARRQLD